MDDRGLETKTGTRHPHPRMVTPIVRRFVYREGGTEDAIEVVGPHLRTLRSGAKSVWDDHAMAIKEAEKRARKLKKTGWVEIEGGTPWRVWDPSANVLAVLAANQGKASTYEFSVGVAPCHRWTELVNVMEWHLVCSDAGTRAVELRIKVPNGWSHDGSAIKPIDPGVRAQVLGALIEARDEVLAVEGVRGFPIEPIPRGDGQLGFDTVWVLGPLHNLQVQPSIERSVSLAFPGWSCEFGDQDGVAVAMARCDGLRFTRWDRVPFPAYRARFDCRPGAKSDKRLLVYNHSPLNLLAALAKANPGGFVEIENCQGETARFEVADGSLTGFATGSPGDVAEAVDRFLRQG